MNVASEAPTGIDTDIALLAEQVQALRALGRRHRSADDGEVYDFSIRWGAALAGRLPRLVHYSSAGLLDEADEHRFVSLCQELRATSDTAERLGLPRPVLPGDEDATQRGHRRFRTRSRLATRRS